MRDARSYGRLMLALVCLFCLLPGSVAVPVLAQEKQAQSTTDISEKEAYEAAKELGTIEAWEAFLENFSQGFRADLARAYLKRIAGAPSQDEAASPNEAAQANEPAQAAAPPPPPEPLPAPPPADLSLAITTQGACRGGRNCSLNVTITNAGGEAFSAPLSIATSIAPGGAALQGTGVPPFSCEGLGGGAVCSQGSTSIAPGQSLTLPITFKMPRNAGGQVTACSSIAWGGVPAALGAREVQRKLNELGFNAGPADGRPGRRTFAAVRAFQQSAGLSPSGTLDLPLYLALFAQGGAGDANPGNDQACAGAAVTSAAPLPAPVIAAPAWKPPRGYGIVNRNVRPKRCSSRSVWLEGQCILKTHVTSFCGPGFQRRGSRCVSIAGLPAGRDGHLLNKQAGPAVSGCPAGQTRVGRNCVNTGLAPVFNILGALGGKPRPRPKPPLTNQWQPANRPLTNQWQPAPQNGQTLQLAPANAPTVNCTAGRIVNAGGRCQCPPSAPLWSNGVCKKCKRGMKFSLGIGCYTSIRTPAATQPNPLTNQWQPAPANAPTVNCSGGRVANANGQCLCPPNRPRWSKGKCKKAKGLNKFLNTLQQPQNQPPGQNVQQPSTQQRNLQQGINQLNQILSDARLKRDIKHVATLDDGLKLYSYRYLWSDETVMGVMAQDLLKDPARAPAVSVHQSGYYMVDYGKLGLDMARLRRRDTGAGETK